MMVKMMILGIPPLELVQFVLYVQYRLVYVMSYCSSPLNHLVLLL